MTLLLFSLLFIALMLLKTTALPFDLPWLAAAANWKLNSHNYLMRIKEIKECQILKSLNTLTST